MSTERQWRIYDYWYKPHEDNRFQCMAYCGELTARSQELAIIRDGFENAVRRRDLLERARLCRYHHENLLFRIYCVRERVWDVLAALTEVPREKSGKRTFRRKVLSVLRERFPTVEAPLNELMILIVEDVRIRNVATHESFLLLGLARGEEIEEFYDVVDLLMAMSPDDSPGDETHKVVKEALSKYVRGQRTHIGEIITTISDFVKEVRAWAENDYLVKRP